MHIIAEPQINEWLQSGTNKKLTEWLVVGKLLFDRNEFMSQLKERLQEFPTDVRN